MRETRLQLFLLILAALFYPITERWFAPWQLTVDYPFLLLFWIALRRGPVPGCLYGFFIGLLRDLADYSQLGATALALSIGGYTVGILREKIDRDNLWVRLLLLMLTYLFVQGVFLLPQAGWSLPSAFFAWLRYSLPGAPLNALAYGLSLFIARLIKEGAALLREPMDQR